MNIHKNARLTQLGRERIVRMAAAGTASGVIAKAAGVSLKTVHKWIARFAAEGMAGLADRSSRPHRLHRPTPAGQVEQIIALRRQRLSGHSERRAEELPRWLHHYNWHRPHGGIQAKTPISRLARDEDNLLTLHI